MAVGRGSDGSYRDAVSIYDRGAFYALFAPIYRTFARLLPAAGSLGNATVYGHIGKIETDHLVVGIEHYLSEGAHDPARDPFVSTTPQGGSRTRLVGDPLVGAPKTNTCTSLSKTTLSGIRGWWQPSG